MSTIYAFTTPARGHIYPLTPILLELRRRGHDVRVWTLSSEIEALAGLGLDAEPIDPAIEALPVNDWEAKNESEAVENTFGTFLKRAPHEVADLQRAIAEQRPDLILTDINAWGAPAAAEASGIQWAAFSPFFTWLPSRGVPVFGPGMKPLGGPLGRVRDAALGKLVQAQLNRKFLGRLNELRAELGVGALDSMTELWTRPPNLLYMTVPELEYQRPSWPGSFEFVGPQSWEPAAEPPSWLAEIDRPIVLVTGSTEYQRDDRLISTALEALAVEDVEVIATAASNDVALFSPPANARVESFVPHAAILERADSVICHGGMGITQKALAAGVPPCVVGWGRDQLETGRRVEVAGAGSFLPQKRLDAERLRASWQQARARRSGAEHLAAAIASAPGAAGAADSLEASIGASGASGGSGGPLRAGTSASPSPS
jgi:MGT family glycosyltransferase